MSEILVLHKIAETSTTITLGWAPPEGAIGYVLYADGVRKSNTWDGAKASWKVDKAAKIEIEALGSLAKGVWPLPPPPASDFTYSPASPKVNEAVTFAVVSPVAGVTYEWDRTLDGVAEGAGVQFVYAYTGEGQKTMRLMANGVVVKEKTLTVTSGTTPPPPSGTTTKTRAKGTLTPNYYSLNDDPSSNYQAFWMGDSNTGVYHFDRLVNDAFAIAWIWRLDEFPGGGGGNWGRILNFHNSPKEIDGVGWSLPNNPPARSPGNSALAVDYISGKLVMNVEDNPVKNYDLFSNPVKGTNYTIALKGVFGRNDGTTARPGSIKIAVNGTYVLDLTNVNTIWLFKNASGQVIIQRYLDLWSGYYTQNLQGGKLASSVCWPWVADTPAAALAKQGGGEGGPWALSNTPIPGKDHSLGPATYEVLAPVSSSDLVLPAGWAS